MSKESDLYWASLLQAQGEGKQLQKFEGLYWHDYTLHLGEVFTSYEGRWRIKPPQETRILDKPTQEWLDQNNIDIVEARDAKIGDLTHHVEILCTISGPGGWNALRDCRPVYDVPFTMQVEEGIPGLKRWIFKKRETLPKPTEKRLIAWGVELTGEYRQPVDGELFVTHFGDGFTRFCDGMKHFGLLSPRWILRKKDPEYVPWTRETVPLGVEINRKNGSERMILTYATQDFVNAGWRYASLLENWTLKSGKPCGTPKQ